MLVAYIAQPVMPDSIEISSSIQSARLLHLLIESNGIYALVLLPCKAHYTATAAAAVARLMSAHCCSVAVQTPLALLLLLPSLSTSNPHYPHTQFSTDGETLLLSSACRRRLPQPSIHA
jgi:hypothetical protein